MIIRTDIVEHLVTDMLVKAGIVGVGAVIVVVAMVVLWKTIGRRR